MTTPNKNRAGRPRIPNLLGATHPALVDEWHPTKNQSSPYQCSTFSNASVWWMCEHGHEWEARVANRTYHGNGCPTCAGKRLEVGFNDLHTRRPDIATQWHPTKNGKLKPNGIVATSRKNIWWRCPEGHEWQATVKNRTNPDRSSGCPHCSMAGQSAIEAEFREYLRQAPALTGVEAAGNTKLYVQWRRRKSMHVDVFGHLARSGKPVVIEYDGAYWHRIGGAPERELAKTEALLNADHLVVRIREDDLGLIPLKHPNLLQLNHDSHARGHEVLLTVMEINSWLASRDHADSERQDDAALAE